MDEPSIAQTGSQAGFGHGFSLPDRPQTRFAGFALTMLAHLGLLAAFLFGVRVAVPMMEAKPLAVSIEKHVQEPPPLVAMKPKLILPDAIQVPVPEFTVQQPPPSPVVASYAPAAPSGTGTAPAGASASTGCAACYLDLVRKYLLRFWIYPREAADRHVQGVVNIHFISDRAGNVISVEVSKSSGHQVLDDAAVALIRRAGQIPPIPADLPVDLLNTTIPIGFRLTPDAEDVESSAGEGRPGRFGR